MTLPTLLTAIVEALSTSATLLARKWESALLVNVDNDTLRRTLELPRHR
jgi:hypothetical protein